MKATPTDKFNNYLQNIFARPYANGLLLLVVVIIAMIWANSRFYDSYHHIFNSDFTVGIEGFSLTEPVHIWINDGLMSIFFFTIGLEIKKEFLEGELSTLKKASLPIVAAIGGMLIPAMLFLAFNYGTEAQNAWGIPMATDIAFTLGLIGLLGTAVSDKLKVFLTALATADDLGAILVIAFFLTPFIDVQSLVAGGIYLLIMATANYLGVRNMWFYIVVGVLGLWIALLLSGIHATLAGVLGALTIPANRKLKEREYQSKLKTLVREFDESCAGTDSLLTHNQENILAKIHKNTKYAGTPLQRVDFKLKPLVNYFILPLFALANAGVRIDGNYFDMVKHPISLGIIAGLVLGKVIGITGFSYLMVKTKISEMPKGSSWKSISGVGIFAGIGFTMSLFIAELAIEEEQLLNIAKVGIITASVLASLLGFAWFAIFKNKQLKHKL
ncbi:Na+/H+ antiporter NhaA [Kordia jejudonensis]|uniref:Na+/H+ antiporter NhaA n=1 Tax=Kordia jejudonensis TaxID=1348245 RepID=UPI00062918CD|nr:Na+/H+ antiporter NhaA [Kordia jejudonensis]